MERKVVLIRFWGINLVSKLKMPFLLIGVELSKLWQILGNIDT